MAVSKQYDLGTPTHLFKSSFLSCKTKGLDSKLPKVPPVQHPIVCGSAKHLSIFFNILSSDIKCKQAELFWQGRETVPIP